MKKVIVYMIAALLLAGCSGNGTARLLPNVSGKAGEVLVVIEKSEWEGAVGNRTRELLACNCGYLPQKEPLYSLVTVTPSGFADIFKIHRNVVMFNINPQNVSYGITFHSDVWAKPQCVIEVSAPDAAGALEMLEKDGHKIASALEQAERDRVISNSIKYEERSIAPKVAEVFGGSPHFPFGYKLKKITSDFAWIADEKNTIQGVLIYKYPVGEGDVFTVENIISKRNEFLQNNVPGMFDNTYMTTSEAMAPMLEHIKFRGREFSQTRGLWEVKNDYMGGPFVSHTFYSPDGKEIIVAEAFVYAPQYDKRQYLRQVESVLWSWEWSKD